MRVILIHGGQVILPELGQALGLYAQEKLRQRQVEIKLNPKVIGYANETVHCADGQPVPAAMLVWAAGVSPSPILKDLPLELQRGRIVGALFYLLILAAGTIAGMLLITTIIAVPITYSANRFQSFNRYVGAAAGAVSLVLGLFLVHQIGFVDGLLR